MNRFDNVKELSKEEDTQLEEKNQNHISISESSENISITDSEYNTNLDSQSQNPSTKPSHWTDAYWETITSHYKWFIHIDGNGGCSICYTNKSIKKKSLMSSLKLRLMNLSYDEFERKLVEHNASSQHEKSLANYKGLCNQSNNSYERQTANAIHLERTPSERDTKRIFPFDVHCSICQKGYKLKKYLAKHIFFCNGEPNSKKFSFPCGCDDCERHSIVDIDEHNTKKHNGTFRFNCKLCNEQHKSATVLYGHLLIDHDCTWNPYSDMPIVLVTSVDGHLDSRPERNRTSSSQLYCDTGNDVDGDDHGAKKRRPNNKIEKISHDDKRETSHLKLSLDQIHTCEHCGGRYLSISILYEHVRTRHAAALESDEALKRKYQKMLLKNDDSLDDKQDIDQHIIMTKKSIDEKTYGHDNQISACLLSCPLCQKCFSTLDARKDHVSRYHPEIQQFICQHCGLIFTNHTNYNRHLEKSHNCIVLSKPSKNSLIINYSCSDCPLVFTNQADLNHHVNFSHREPVVKPNVTPVHEIETPKIVEKVIKNGQSEILLRGLLEADPTESRCVCTNCDAVMHNTYEFAVHGLSHDDGCKDDINLQSCPNCSRLFFGENSKIYLKDHYNVEHLKKPVPSCLLCKTTFTSTLTYDLHRVTGVCCLDNVREPYEAFMMMDRLAFACAQCGVVLAGCGATERLGMHMNTCTSDLMDDDEFLD